MFEFDSPLFLFMTLRKWPSCDHSILEESLNPLNVLKVHVKESDEISRDCLQSHCTLTLGKHLTRLKQQGQRRTQRNPVSRGDISVRDFEFHPFRVFLHRKKPETCLYLIHNKSCLRYKKFSIISFFVRVFWLSLNTEVKVNIAFYFKLL